MHGLTPGAFKFTDGIAMGLQDSPVLHNERISLIDSLFIVSFCLLQPQEGLKHFFIKSFTMLVGEFSREFYVLISIRSIFGFSASFEVHYSLLG
jgi:hypothetical protein